jgi:hypothetical protein
MITERASIFGAKVIRGGGLSLLPQDSSVEKQTNRHFGLRQHHHKRMAEPRYLIPLLGRKESLLNHQLPRKFLSQPAGLLIRYVFFLAHRAESCFFLLNQSVTDV